MRDATKGPTILVSRCLLGVACRYDGTRRPCQALDRLPTHWVLLDVCPEEDLGMGVPRPPIALLETDQLRLVERISGRDWTAAMSGWCRDFSRILLRDGASGAVLKARSPSCGTGDAELFRDRGALAWPPLPDQRAPASGDGFWVRALKSCAPDFPLISDEELADPETLARFQSAVESRHRTHAPRGF